MTALNCIYNSICEVNKDTTIAVAIQFAIIAVDGYNIPGGLSYFGQSAYPVWNMGTVPFKWVGSLAAAQACFYLSRKIVF